MPTDPDQEQEDVVSSAVGNLRRLFPNENADRVRELVGEAFDRIADRDRSPAFVALLAERHVRDVLRREQCAELA